MSEPVVVRVPASSANLGAGFDVLAMALDLYLDVGSGDPPEGAHSVDRHHLAAKAFAEHTGTAVADGAIWVRSSIPMGRGLGYSGAARVGGAALAAFSGIGEPAVNAANAPTSALDVAARLEGHGDNAAASALGGVVAWVDGRAMSLGVGPQLAAAAVVIWIPDSTTSTVRSRSTLPDVVERRAAVHNLGRVAQFVLAIEHDDPSLLVGATDDRLHQATRLAHVQGAAEALDAGVEAGAWCGWLSGSGPAVAFLADDAVAQEVAASLPDTGHVKQLRIARRGAFVVPAAGGSGGSGGS